MNKFIYLIYEFRKAGDLLMRILTDIVTDNAELKNVVMERSELPPENPEGGQLFYCTLNDQAYVYIDGKNQWQSLTDMTSAVIKIKVLEPLVIDETDPIRPIVSIKKASGESDGYMTKEDKSLLDSNTFKSEPNTLVKRDNKGNFKTNIPLTPLDVANKGYVDQIIHMYNQIKPPVRIATEEETPLFAERPIQGISLVENDRVLVRSQSNGAQNGIYKVQKGAWVRSEDLLGYATMVFVEQGKFADFGFYMKNPSNPGKAPNIGTDAIKFDLIRFLNEQINTGGGSTSNKTNDVFVSFTEPHPEEGVTPDDIWIQDVLEDN